MRSECDDYGMRADAEDGGCRIWDVHNRGAGGPKASSGEGGEERRGEEGVFLCLADKANPSTI